MGCRIVSVLGLLISAEASILRCNQPSFTCPDDQAVCECVGTLTATWRIHSTTMSILFEMLFDANSPILEETSTNSLYSAVLCNRTQDPSPPSIRLLSKITFNLTQNVDVECVDNDGPNTITLRKASSPSPPQNINSTVISAGFDGASVHLNWDPPLNNGGVNVTNYLISVNMSQQVVVTDTTTTLTLNSTGQHLIEISAVNECGIVSDNSLTVIDTDIQQITVTSDVSISSTTSTVAKTGTISIAAHTMTTLLSSTPSPNTTVFLTSMPANPFPVIGVGAGITGGIVVILLVAISILCVAIFVARSRGKSRQSKDFNMVNGQEEYSRFTYNMAQPPVQNGVTINFEAEYSAIVPPRQVAPESLYSVTELKHGAKPEPIPNHDSVATNLQANKPAERTLNYLEVEISSKKRKSFKPSTDNIEYAEVKKIHPIDKQLNLNSMLVILGGVQSKWEEIGLALEISPETIQHIRRTTSGEDYDYLMEVCDEWLRNLCNQKVTPTWSVIGDALNKIGCKEISKIIQKIYRTGKLPETATRATDEAREQDSNNTVTQAESSRPLPELPQYDDVIPSANSPPPIPPQRF